MTSISHVLHCALVWWASQYSPGIMDQVRANRQLDPVHVDGYIAVADCADIGQVWWIRPIGQAEWESFQVMDCAAPNDGAREWMARNRIIVEVDHLTAVRWGTVGRGIRVQIKGPVRVPVLEW